MYLAVCGYYCYKRGIISRFASKNVGRGEAGSKALYVKELFLQLTANV